MSENGFIGASSRIKKIRYAVTVILVLFVIVAVFSYREDLTVENFRYLMKYVDVRPVTFGSAENAQISFESDSSTVSSSFKEDLVVASKTAVRIYDLSSKEILSSSHALTKPQISTGNKYFAVYDLGSKYLGIYNSFSKLWETTLDYPIYGVELDDKGNFCVVTASKGYASALKVYNSSFDNMFNWRSADKYAVSADIMTDGDVYLAVGSLRATTSGDMVSSLIFLSNASPEPLFTLDFEGEMTLDVSFNEDGRVVYLTDKALRFTDRKGKILNEYPLNPKTIRKFETGGKYTALILNENLVGKDHKAIIFDEEGNTYLEKTVKSEITDLALSDSFLFLLGVEDVSVLNLKDKTTSTYPSERSYRSVEIFDEENVYLVYDGLAVAAGVE